MKKFRKWITSPKATVILFVMAAGLLLFSVIGAVRAAFLATSATYAAHLEMYDIGVSLLEKSQKDESPRIVAARDHIVNSEDKWDGEEVGKLLPAENFLGSKDAKFVPGKTYPEEISVKNTGNIDEYVRVTVYKYWTDPEGNKVFDTNAKGTSTQGLSPALIDLNLINSSVWLLDKNASTEERTVLYYNKVLKVGESTVPICDTLTIDSAIAEKATQTKTTDENGYTTISTIYDYDGWQFFLEAQVDAVQDHNIADAAKSAWGVDLTVSKDGQIKLAD